jgi:hypothetical protein
MNHSRSKNCPRCQKQIDVPIADLHWLSEQVENDYTSRLEKLFEIVTCDECVAELDADRKKGDVYRRQRAARAESYANNWLQADIEHHTFAASRRDYEQRSSDIENAFEWGRTGRRALRKTPHLSRVRRALANLTSAIVCSIPR